MTRASSIGRFSYLKLNLLDLSKSNFSPNGKTTKFSKLILLPSSSFSFSMTNAIPKKIALCPTVIACKGINQGKKKHGTRNHIDKQSTETKAVSSSKNCCCIITYLSHTKGNEAIWEKKIRRIPGLHHQLDSNLLLLRLTDKKHEDPLTQEHPQNRTARSDISQKKEKRKARNFRIQSLRLDHPIKDNRLKPKQQAKNGQKAKRVFTISLLHLHGDAKDPRKIGEYESGEDRDETRWDKTGIYPRLWMCLGIRNLRF